jgi:hypothetical protein
LSAMLVSEDGWRGHGDFWGYPNEDLPEASKDRASV